MMHWSRSYDSTLANMCMYDLDECLLMAQFALFGFGTEKLILGSILVYMEVGGAD